MCPPPSNSSLSLTLSAERQAITATSIVLIKIYKLIISAVAEFVINPDPLLSLIK